MKVESYKTQMQDRVRFEMALCFVGCGNRHPIHRYRIS